MPRELTDNELAELQRSLSPDELRQMWRRQGMDGEIPILDYDDVINSSDIHDLFKHGEAIVLYYPLQLVNNGVSGHYTAMTRSIDKNKPTIYYYDSYGYKPDGIKRYKNKKDKLYQEKENSLIARLMDSNVNVDYSPYKHQKLHYNSLVPATCGRHSLLRCMFGSLSNDDYDKLLKKMKKKVGTRNYDEMVTLLIQ